MWESFTGVTAAVVEIREDAPVAVAAAAEEEEEELEKDKEAAVRGAGARTGTAEVRVWEEVRGVAAAAVDTRTEAAFGTSDGRQPPAFTCRARLVDRVNT